MYLPGVTGIYSGCTMTYHDASIVNSEIIDKLVAGEPSHGNPMFGDETSNQ